MSLPHGALPADLDASMVAKAQQLWTMLDDMAAHNPEASCAIALRGDHAAQGYKDFIDKQRREHDELQRKQRPPEPIFSLLTTEVMSSAPHTCVTCADRDGDGRVRACVWV